MAPSAFRYVIPIQILVLTFTAAWIERTGDARTGFAAIVLQLLVLCVASGLLAVGRIAGILVDETNRLSLSRFQWVVWFIIIFGGFVTGALLRARSGADPLTMDENLYGLLGIVTGSTLVSGVIDDAKKNAPQANPNDVTQHGAMDRNVTVGEASWSDLFLGEEVANRTVIDLSRLQKLVTTLVLGVVYTGMLWNMFSAWDTPPEPAAMPAIGRSFLVLLGISHAGYLGAKATTKTVTPPPAA